jgi:adenosine deaminase
MTEDFQAALANDDLDALRRCPKADLHNHGAYSGNRAFILERTGQDVAPLHRKLGSMAEMHAWVSAAVTPLFDGADGRLLGFEAAFVQALRDGVTRIEFGDDVWVITRGYGSAAELTRSLQALHRAVAPSIEWLPQLGMSRHCSIAALQRWLAPFLELRAHKTLDLSGDELAQPIEAFKPLYRAAEERGLRLKAHVGEWGSAEDVRSAVDELHLDEVQHGIAAADSPAVMRFLADNRIRLNVCPTSNLMLGRVDSLARHPIRKLYDAGVKVTVNTDDCLVFGKSVSEEFLELHRAGLFTVAELDQIRLNGLTDD